MGTDSICTHPCNTLYACTPCIYTLVYAFVHMYTDICVTRHIMHTSVYHTYTTHTFTHAIVCLCTFVPSHVHLCITVPSLCIPIQTCAYTHLTTYASVFIHMYTCMSVCLFTCMYKGPYPRTHDYIHTPLYSLCRPPPGKRRDRGSQVSFWMICPFRNREGSYKPSVCIKGHFYLVPL